jgi:hypothetical protein
VTERTDDEAPGTDRTHHAHGADRVRAQRLVMAEPRGLVALIPRRDLVRIGVLLLILAVIVALQRGSGSIVKRFTEGLAGPTPTVIKPQEPPRVRLSPPVKGP